MATLKYKNGNSWNSIKISGDNATIKGCSLNSINNATGTPTASVSLSDTSTSPTFKFSFTNLKGAKGATGDNGGKGGLGHIFAAVHASTMSGSNNVTYAQSTASLTSYRMYLHPVTFTWTGTNPFSYLNDYYVYASLAGWYGVSLSAQVWNMSTGGIWVGYGTVSSANATSFASEVTDRSADIYSNITQNNFPIMIPETLFRKTTAQYFLMLARQTAGSNVYPYLDPGRLTIYYYGT